MSFEIVETSRQRGEPVTLFLFVYDGAEGDSPAPSHFAYTDAEQQIVSGGFTYSPIPIARDAVTASGTLDRAALTVRMPRDIALSELFRVYPPIQPVTLIIRQGHLSDDSPPPEFLVVWSGRVLSVGRERDECVVSCEPVASSLRRPGLRRHYQYGCPHVLYGDQCGANRAAATVSATVASVGATSVTLTGGWNGAFAAAKFREGILEWTNDEGGVEKRKILAVSGNTLSIGGLLRDLAATDAVSVILGCNHQMDDCEDLHVNDALDPNIQNYGGCPWIPTKNPIGFRNHYY